MKVGSLVILEEFFTDIHPDKNVIYPVKEVIYTVRLIRDGMVNPKEKYILLEEIVNPKGNYDGIIDEPAFWIERFREIQPPMDIKIEDFIVEKQTV